ncbi:hypothetical protein ACA910_005625 [Epithemia clementina (nom. ined.)]
MSNSSSDKKGNNNDSNSSTTTSTQGKWFSIVEKPKPLVVEDELEASKRCNEWVASGLKSNKAIQFMLQTLEDLGCTPPTGFISCRQCDRPQASGFGKVVVDDHQTNDSNGKECGTVLRDFESALAYQKQQQQERQQEGGTAVETPKLQPEIFVCQQYLENETMTHKVMVHELVHAIDLCRSTMNPVHNCLHLACTEIRAENLSGECSFFKELPRILFQTGEQFQGHGADCVRRRALLSVRANPQCAARASDYVQAAMPRCVLDHYPFCRHPNQGDYLKTTQEDELT